MGFDVAFFAAPDDAAAAEAERRPGGPLGWPTTVGVRKTGWFRKEPIIEESGPAFDGFATRGYDGVANMGALEELLSGTPYDELEDDPRWGAQVADEDAPGDRGVLALTTTLRDALVAADNEQLASIVRPWAETEELAPPDGSPVDDDEVDSHLTFLRDLRALAVRAKEKDHGLYWYFQA